MEQEARYGEELKRFQNALLGAKTKVLNQETEIKELVAAKAAKEAFWRQVRNERAILPCNVPDGVRSLRKGCWEFRSSLLASLSPFGCRFSGYWEGKACLSPPGLLV